MDKRAPDAVQKEPEVVVKQELPNNMYYVEKIIDRKVMGGEVLLLVKWVGYSNKDNTWEPRTNLLEDCPGLVEDFERDLSAHSEMKEERKEKEDPKPGTSKSATSRNKGDTSGRKVVPEEIPMPDGPDPGPVDIQPAKIHGRVDYQGEACFIVEWEGSSEISVVTVDEMKEVLPQVVIAYYEEKFLRDLRRPLQEMLGPESDVMTGSVLEDSLDFGGNRRNPSDLAEWMEQCNLGGVEDSEEAAEDEEMKE